MSRNSVNHEVAPECPRLRRNTTTGGAPGGIRTPNLLIRSYLALIGVLDSENAGPSRPGAALLSALRGLVGLEFGGGRQLGRMVTLKGHDQFALVALPPRHLVPGLPKPVGKTRQAQSSSHDRLLHPVPPLVVKRPPRA